MEENEQKRDMFHQHMPQNINDETSLYKTMLLVNTYWILESDVKSMRIATTWQRSRVSRHNEAVYPFLLWVPVGPVHRGLGQALMAMAHELQMSENQDPTFSLASNVEIDDHNRNQIGSQSALRFIFFF